MSRAKHSEAKSEDTPLTTSDSYYSESQLTFRDFQSSGRNSNPDAVSSRYGSVEATSYTSTITRLPTRLPPVERINNNTVNSSNNVIGVSPASKNVASAVNFAQERCYDLYKIDLLLDEEKFNGLLQSMVIDTKPKQNSVVTIFSIWNTILGSSLLTMPWGISMAGFVPAIILILTMSGLCLYTAHKLLQVRKYYGGDDRIEVIELSQIYLGSWAANLAKVFSITVLLGATIAYWILMSNFFYYSVIFIYDMIKGIPTHTVNNGTFPAEVLCPKEELINSTAREISYDSLGPAWDLYKTVPLFLAFLIFPLLNFNSTTFFTKFNSLGTASIVYLIVFVLVKSSSWGIQMNSSTWENSWVLRPTFPALSGMLALSFFIHNIIISIMKNNQDQRKNGRDLTIAYFLVTLTYTIVGVTFYVCFPLPKWCIEDNLLNNFQNWDGMTVAARVLLLFQLFTVYPLITYMLRVEILSSVIKTTFCSRRCVIFVNSVIVTISILFAMFLPRIGTIIRYTGAASGLVYIFTLPCLLYLVMTYRQGTMTTCSIFSHVCISIIGLLNFASQFIISENR